MVCWSLAVARSVCDGVVLVLPAEGEVPDEAWDADSVVRGGYSRSDSVRSGLKAVPAEATEIVVHDGARPLAPPDLWSAVIGAVRSGAAAAIPACPVTDTIKQLGACGPVTLDREALVAVQTPQAFRAEVLRQAHARAQDTTDDAALVEALGCTVALVEGQAANLKITTRTDLLMASALIGGGA